MKKIALISALLFFIVYFLVNIFMPDEDYDSGVKPPSSATQSDGSGADDEAVTDRIMEAGASSDANTGVISDSQARPAVGFYLIVGSFTDYDQARRVAGEYARKFPAEFIILPPTTEGFYRISCGKYSTSEAASAMLPDVRDRINSRTWIYSIKKPL